MQNRYTIFCAVTFAYFCGVAVVFYFATSIEQRNAVLIGISVLYLLMSFLLDELAKENCVEFRQL